MSNKKQPGYVALITVLVVGAVFLVVALSLLTTGIYSGKTSLTEGHSVQARSAANACSEIALGAIQANITLSTPYTFSIILDPALNIRCNYTISGTSPNFTIVSEGRAGQNGDIVKRNTIFLNRVGPTLNISSWEEVR